MKPRVAFFIGTFPKLSESWFSEQLTSLLKAGEVDIDLFAFKAGPTVDWTPALEAYGLRSKVIYLDRPQNLIKRFILGCFYSLKIISHPKIMLRLISYYRTHPEGKDLPHVFWFGPLISTLPKYKL